MSFMAEASTVFAHGFHRDERLLSISGYLLWSSVRLDSPQLDSSTKPGAPSTLSFCLKPQIPGIGATATAFTVRLNRLCENTRHHL